MGASTFYEFVERGSHTTAKQAFDATVAEAKYEHGHGGYSGTIAEKSDFVSIMTMPDRFTATAVAEAMVDKGDRRIDDKWGPAGCIEVGTEGWLFFGWASE